LALRRNGRQLPWTVRQPGAGPVGCGYAETMTAISRSDVWYLFDYGMVISMAPEAADWAALEGAAGRELEERTSPYWAMREPFDAGKLTPKEYWSGVLGRAVDAAEVDALEAMDAMQWSHLNAETLAVLETLHAGQSNLALLSNMPAQMAGRYAAGSPWVGYFSKLYFSGELGMVKPDPRIFDHVVAELGAETRNVVFIDDSHANIATAGELGLNTVHYTPGMDLLDALSAAVCR